MIPNDRLVDASRVHRATLWTLLKHAVLTLFCIAVTVAVGARIGSDHSDWKGWGLLALFGVASVILSGILVGKARTRIVLRDDTIAAVTRSKTVELRWEEIARVERIRVGAGISYVLKSARGEQIVVDRGMQRFEELVDELRERLGPLPGDSGSE